MIEFGPFVLHLQTTIWKVRLSSQEKVAQFGAILGILRFNHPILLCTTCARWVMAQASGTDGCRTVMDGSHSIRPHQWEVIPHCFVFPGHRRNSRKSPTARIMARESGAGFRLLLPPGLTISL